MSKKNPVNQFIEDYIQLLPKVELHLHLEGVTSPALLLRLATKHGTELAGSSETQIREELYSYSDFYDFLETYKVVCQHLREPDDYLLLMDWLQAYLIRENIRYCEVIYTPSIPWKYERDGREILQALLERSAQFEKRHGIQIRWILDNVRQFGKEAAERTVELAVEFHSQGVVAVGVGGDEKSIPLKEFEDVFSWAQANQLYVHVHAGEIGDPVEIWEALQLGANRIGHGIQAARDPKLMEYLRERAVSLDLCLTSNISTGAWAMYRDHPCPLFLRRGVPFTLNTDDPGLFETALGEELKKAVHYYNLRQENLNRLILQAAKAAFLAHDQKMELLQSLHAEIQSLAESENQEIDEDLEDSRHRQSLE